MPESPGRFVVLDSWRGIAALLVVLFHCRYRSHIFDVPLIRHGWFAVDFFFVLSGFVISYAFGRRIASPRDFGVFLIRRTGRLWPLHVFMLAALVVPWARSQASSFLYGSPSADTGENTMYSIITNVLMIHALGLHNELTWNGPSWSVSTEYYTNLLYGLVVLLCGRFVTGASLLLGMVGAAGVIVFTSGKMGTTINYGIFRCMEGFFLGSLVYLVFQHLPRARIPRNGGTTALELAALGLAGVFMTYADDVSRLALLAPLVFGVVVLVFAFERGMISRLLQRRAFVMAGALSYSIYLTHAYVYMWLYRGYRYFGPRWGIETWIPGSSGDFQGNVWMADLMTLVFVVLVVTMSMLTYWLVEQPGRRIFNRAVSET